MSLYILIFINNKLTKSIFLYITLSQINIIKHHQYHINYKEMILNGHYQVKLQKTIKKILYLYPAFNDTFVFLALINQRKDGVVHVDKHGKILFEHIFGIPMDTMGMFSDKQVIFLQIKRNKIVVLNLQTHSFSEFPHQFMYEQSDQTQIHTFSQTRYLCVQQKGRYNNAKYKLTYYRYPLQLQQKNNKKYTKYLALYESASNEWTYQYMTRKANNYSIMCWYKPRHDDSFQFKTYEIVDNKGRYKLYKFNNAIAAQANLLKVQTAILNVWELRKSHFVFVCLTNKTESKKSGGTVINNNFVVNVENGQIRQAKFTFGPYQDYLIDYYNLGSYSMFKTFKVEDNKILKTPIYYIDNYQETIIGEQAWQCTHEYKYEFPGYISGLLCEGIYDNVDNSEFKVNLKRVVKAKQIYLHLLDNCGFQISEDLIFDTICVLQFL